MEAFLQILFSKKEKKIQLFSQFFLVIETLDPDPDSLEMLDPDPDHPQHRFLPVSPLCSLS